jgi:hypothetical protein
MNFSELAEILSKEAGQSVYMKCQPEILDFTEKNFIPELQFYFQGGKEIKLRLQDDNLYLTLQMLRLSLFGKGMRVVCWNWKNFISYILAKTGKGFAIDGGIIDLKILESYSGRKLQSPKNLNEALFRLKDLITSNIWKEIEPVYKKIHLPLMTVVIPHLEAVGVIDSFVGKKVYAYYEIDGQENGRLKCSGAYSSNYIPHALKPENRQSLKTREDTELFMVFDYKGMEVFMLAWMSKDPLLEELCRTPDIYVSLYENIVGKNCEGKNDRELAKKIFLPVIYGQSAYSLSQRCGIALDAAETIVERIDSLFPVASAFVGGYQKQLQEFGYAKDIFGKRRSFEVGKEYSVRNFSIQSPAAIVCLEKLNHLYFALKDKTDIVYTVHDGYAVYAKKENWKTIFKIGRDVLSGESDFCPGLRLRVTCRAGRNLNDLKSLSYKGD